MVNELRHALRRLVMVPGFTSVALVTLALGIGANTAVYSVVDAVMLRPLPYAEPDRLVMAWQDYTRRGGPETEWFSPANFYDIRAENRVLSGLAAFTGYSPTMTSADGAERLPGALVTHGFFEVLGTDPVLGRTFTEEEELPGNDAVVLLSYGLWQSRFGGAASVVGRTITLDGTPHVVIGVLPQGFEFPLVGPARVWSSLGIDLANAGRGNVFLRTVGRLRPGVSLAEAEADLDRVARGLEEAYPDANTGVGAHLTRLRDQLVGNLRPGLLALMGAVVLVLLIACVNLANLLLVRSAARRRDRAIRTALGASRMRLVLDTLTESLLVSVAGAAVGVLVAAWLIDALVALSPIVLPPLFEPALDGGVLAFALGLSVVTGLAFGIVPALHGLGASPVPALKEDGVGSGIGRRGRRTRRTLVGAQVALAFALLAGAGLLLRSFMELQAVDPGFDPEGVLTFSVGAPSSEYEEPEEVTALYEAFLERIRSMPAVRSAGMVSHVPMADGDTDVDFVIEGRPAPGPGRERVIWYRQVDPAYFRTMGIPVLAGRAFDASDNRRNAAPVVVLGEAAAARFFPGEDPVGRRIKPGTDPESDGPWWTIVGVVGSVRHAGLAAAPKEEMYLPHALAPRRAMTVVVRTDGEPGALVPSIRAELHRINPNLALSGVGTAERLVAGSAALPRFLAVCLVTFAALALVLAGIGIYGVIAYAVGERTHELGVRVALGARPGDVVRLVLRQGALFVTAGLVVGFGAALVVGRIIQTLLFQVAPRDPIILTAVPLVLAVVALAAMYVPARRATRVDPLVALREG